MIVIDEGASLKEISETLMHAGLVRSSRAFTLLGILAGDANRLRPGRYTFKGTERGSTILRVLVKGPQVKTIVIPEGSTLLEIDAILANANIIESGAFTTLSADLFSEQFPFLKGDSLEGYLFPDTYAFVEGESVEKIVEEFLVTFKKKALPLFKEPTVMYNKLILASILEKEVVSQTDRRIVAGILEKRIAQGIPLQIDATVIYAKCKAFKGCDTLTKSDFSIKSPINTYRVSGLPPQPIGNPGLTAIEAALHTQSSPYLYYLSDPKTGKTIFSKTFAEHDENRAFYLR